MIITICTFKVIHCYLQICLKIFATNALKYINLIHLIFFSTWISMASLFKTTEIKLDLLTDIDMLLMIEKGIEVEYVVQYIDMQKHTINTWKTITMTRNHHICTGMQTIFMDGQCLNYLLMVLIRLKIRSMKIL